MSKEHLSVALALNVPVVCVVTKIDSTPPNVLDSTLKQLTKILRSPGCRKSPIFVKNRGMACSLAKGFVIQKLAYFPSQAYPAIDTYAPLQSRTHLPGFKRKWRRRAISFLVDYG